MNNSCKQSQTETFYLSNSALDKLWKEYVQEHFPDSFVYFSKQQRIPHINNYLYMKNHPCREAFEAWMFARGAILRRKHKRMYAEFTVEEYATFFILKYQ